MNIENFAEWHLRQGHRVVQSKSSWWYEASPHVYQAFPFHWLIDPSESEIQTIIHENKMAALRYSTPVDAPLGKISYHILKNSPYSIGDLTKKSRRDVIQGLANCVIERISFSCMAEEGWILQKDTLDRQGRKSGMDQKEWQQLVSSAEGIDGFECWGAKVQDKLAAALLGAHINSTWYTLYLLSHRAYLNHFVNHALYFSFAHEKLSDKEIDSIFCTVQSLDAPKSVDDFKLRLGFKAVPVRQRVVFHPLMQPLVNAFSRKLIHILNQGINHAGIQKLEGMVNFYLQGRLPIDEQDWPDCLRINH